LYGLPYFVLLILLGYCQLVAAEDLAVGTFELKADLIYQEDFSTAPKNWKSEGRGKVWT